ncbi:hypothetical protein P7C71_g933, partial [Lecanoromycetidae sp. Uapishka_2]
MPINTWTKEEEAVILYFSSRNVHTTSIVQILALKLDSVRGIGSITYRLRELRTTLVALGHPAFGQFKHVSQYQLERVDKWLFENGGGDLLRLIDWGDGTWPIGVMRQRFEEFPLEKQQLQWPVVDEGQPVMDADAIINSMLPAGQQNAG